MKKLTKRDFKKELAKSDSTPLRFNQLCNEYPLYTATIVKAYASLMADLATA